MHMCRSSLIISFAIFIGTDKMLLILDEWSRNDFSFCMFKPKHRILTQLIREPRENAV